MALHTTREVLADVVVSGRNYWIKKKYPRYSYSRGQGGQTRIILLRAFCLVLPLSLYLILSFSAHLVMNTIFRTDDCDLCIKLPVVSRKQAIFRLVKFSPEDNPAAAASDDDIPLGVFVIANFGTTNPIKLNDKAVTPVGREYGEFMI